MEELKFIAQPYKSMLCGQTCLSMITGNELEDICTDLSKDWLTCIQSDLQAYLNRKGFKTRLVSGQKITFKEVPNNSYCKSSIS